MVARTMFPLWKLALLQALLVASVAQAQPFSRMDSNGGSGSNAPVVVIPDDPRMASGDYSRSAAPRPYFSPSGSPSPAEYASQRYSSRPPSRRYDGVAGSEMTTGRPSDPYRRYDIMNGGEERPLQRPVYRRPHSSYRLAAKMEGDGPTSVVKEGGESAPPSTKKGSEGDMLPHPPNVTRKAPPPGEEVPPGPRVLGPSEEYVDTHEGGYDAIDWGENCHYDECDDNDCDYDPFLFLRLLTRWSRNLTVDAGVEAFKGPMDFGIVGNFGFHEGINWGIPLFPWWEVGVQIGFEAVNTDLQRGSNPFIDHYREQYFLTAGVFHRPGPCGGLQWGIAYDHLNDDYYRETQLGQMRGEISWCGAHQHEIGFWTAVHLNHESNVDMFRQREDQTLMTIEALDQYNFFYRRRFCEGGNFRLWGGFTGQSDAIFGGDFHVPLSNHCAVQSTFNYIMPHENVSFGTRESWNLGLSVVFYPGGRARCGDRSLYRPLFDVADNGTFIADVR